MKTHIVYLAAMVAVILTVVIPVRANTLTWDANTGTSGAQDGSGNWNTSTLNWWDGLSSALWDNSTPDSAIIGNGGAAGVITLTTGITVGNLTFASGGSGNYVITNNTLTLSTPTTITANKDATIKAALAGGALTKTGSAAVYLSEGATNSSYSGEIIIAEGAIGATKLNNKNTTGVLGNSDQPITLGSSGKTGELGLFAATGVGASTDRSFVLATGGKGRFSTWVFAADTLTVNGGISGSGDVELVSLGGYINLSGTNTFTGNVSVTNRAGANAGICYLGGPYVNTISNVTVSGGPESNKVNSLYMSATGGGTNALTIAGTYTANTNGYLVFYANGGTNNSPVVLNGGRLSTDGYKLTMSLNGPISGNGRVYLWGNPNYITIGGTSNTYTGTTLLQGNNTAPLIYVTKLANIGVASSFGAPPEANAAIEISKASLIYTGSGDACNRPFKLMDAPSPGNNGASEISQSGAGLLLLSGAFTNVATTNWMYLLLSGSTVGIGEISGAISDGVVPTPITKSGTGVWILSGTNTLSTNVTVSGGVLVYRYTASKPSPGTNSVASGAALGLGVGGSGCFTATDVDNLYANTLSWAGLNANAGVGLDTGAGDFTYATSQTNNRALHKTGANMLTLTGSNTNTRGATVWDGTLAVSNANALGASGTITVNSNAAFGVCAGVTWSRSVTFNPGAALSGQGTYSNSNWTTPTGLVLKPGLPAGTLTVNVGGVGKTLTFGTNNTLRIVIQPDGSSGKLLVNGALDISAPTARLVVTGTVPAAGIVLAEGTSRVGQFQEANVDLTGLSKPCSINYTPTQVILNPPARGTSIMVW